MHPQFFFSLHFQWIILVVFNFTIQLSYFFNDKNNLLFIIKKITTPLLLFWGLLIVVLDTQSFPIIPCVILAAMGLGELGIEGSSIVESKEEGEAGKKKTSIIVTLAGVLFLLVNVFIGTVLIIQGGDITAILSGAFLSIIIIVSMCLAVFKIYNPDSEIKIQIKLYSIGLIILCAGTLANIIGGISNLGIAAAILTVSDSLVLIRMGADYKKNSDSGFKTLLTFLLAILILYYVYIGILIHIGSPFRF